MPYKNKCEICGKSRNIHKHHITPRRIFDIDDGNIINVCRKCHSKIHRIYIENALNIAFGVNPRFFDEIVAFLKDKGKYNGKTLYR